MTEFFISDTHFSAFNVVFRQNHTRLSAFKEAIDVDIDLDTGIPMKTAHNFETINELDALMIHNWNNRVKKSDTVYFLGDLAILQTTDRWVRWLTLLNGNKVFVVGNHDQSRVLKAALKVKETHIVEVVETAKLIRRRKQQLWLSHYPTLLSSRFVNVHGHIHARPIQSMLVPADEGGDIEPHHFFNVGVDSPDMTFLPLGAPVSLDELLERVVK